MEQMFYWILNMAIVSSLVGMILLAIRMVRKISRKFIYFFYLILVFRLVCPFGIISGFSFLSILPEGTIHLVDPITGGSDVEESQMMLSNVMQTADSYQPLQYKNQRWGLIYHYGAIIWLTIMSILILYYLTMYIIAKREMGKARHIMDNVFEGKSIHTPITVGILHPRILLPLGLIKNQEILPYVIAHERTHIRKKDNLWRIISIVLTCVYWFNPLIWILQKCFMEDMELACDESTIRGMDPNKRKGYAKALLEVSVGNAYLPAVSFGGNGVKKRIRYIVSYKQMTLVSCIGLLILFIISAVCLLSNS